jgi:hypothetical protein
MAFDVERLFEFCVAEIKRFAQTHQGETFYAFAVDEGLLCLNSEEAFARTLEKYQENWDHKIRPIERWEELSKWEVSDADQILEYSEEDDGLDRSDQKACLAVINEYRARERARGNQYRTAAGIKTIRQSTGAWAYQGFATMTDSVGFDDAAYQEHYGLSDEEQTTSAYGIAMDRLVQRLRESGVFECLRKAPDFYATRVEHIY